MLTFDEWCRRWHVPPQAVTELVMPRSDVNISVASGHSESHVQTTIRLAAARAGIYLWRNNSGAARDETGRVIRYGLGNDSKKINDLFKSPDLCGIGPDGRFVGIECKPSDWRGPKTAHEQAQFRFLATIISAGGIAGFARSAEDFHALLA
jgi:hypothetical protein